MRITISPRGSMSLLSQLEIDRLQESSDEELYRLFRNCCLAVLNAGSNTDSSEEIFEKYKDFDVNVIKCERGVKLELVNPPAEAFVDGKLIVGMQELVEAVLRDILFTGERYNAQTLDSADTHTLTHVVFDILRNAQVVQPNLEPNIVVCWGGHSINEIEYKYTKEVGYHLGLRALNICTGCGPGAMKGPMKGAAIGHAKQRIPDGRYLGFTEPGIIAAEPPNPIVNELVILPDIEKRLEAFVRCAHGIVIFPGGAGTAEELLYILGILMHPANERQVFPIVLTGPASSKGYFDAIDDFIVATLGEEARKLYTIIINDPVKVARHMCKATDDVKEYRRETGDSYCFNWTLHIDEPFQRPFSPTHENVAGLNLHREQEPQLLAADLRRAFSAIVAGNVKDEGIRAIRAKGVFEIHGEREMMRKLDVLLQAFVEQGRMKLPGSVYYPCYRVVTD
ncbi:nucleotide 5'-monophosphate nucleosidase PpnN [Pseudidiomarina terrestris]|uniref:Pyrimidine/purine nucleotide 5'-monophosphate nucleosidase n=1 Tax=Pseudidiomarina terrestris TaxID=2820060 RepID=A0AAW7QUX4_9GAMM|nr:MULTISPECIES: nucleotide 5'-monophosphate nucleosidase PpnN [unclassified Pseudidiomarina]MDN7123539.1 LOG family protein [Pseudidiomarina sp. 1APP75-32.1]MDN7126671.1 LOG family protein [Pseudidiomarina sp. 1APR75-33.1]MDN7128737.1 LOG family protein [Pseudidiomarina sp. 1APR75-15]MDN7135004.1 LOG family protein [Pseudidiomarina sp. 1ASP75-5]MDN7137675.1 LOG family protein [Pseudidiomarina sp. 1ASP75-14]